MKLSQFWQNLGNPAVYYPKIAAVTGGATAAIFVLKVLQWQDSQLWVKVNPEEITAETGLNLAEQKLARQQLKQQGLLEERPVPGETSVMEIRLDFDTLEDYLAGGLNSRPKSQTPQPDPYFPVKRQPIAVTVTPNYQFSGPWESPEQLENFQRQLLEYGKQKGMQNPSGWVFKIVDGLTKGMISPFWDEFIAEYPLGSTQQVQRDWEVEPGVAYPAFEEERIQYYVHKGEPLEVAVSKARSDLRKPVLAQDLWDGFLRKCDRLADRALKAKQQGLQTPYLPPSFSDRREVNKEQVMQKLLQISSPETSKISLPESKSSESSESSEPPSLEQLQKAYQSTIGRSWVKQQLQQHPEWGYEIIDNQVQPSLPF